MSLPEICSDSAVVNATLQFDGDIAGLGVRLSFYLQTFILVLLVNRSPDDAPGALWTLTATSCGLTVAAIVQVASHSLSLVEAILVCQLVWLANIASFIASASYSRNKGPDSFVKFVTVGQGYVSMILTIVMWRYADKLGQYPECNGLVSFVLVFAVERPALGSGRTASLVCASIILCAYTFLTLEELAAWWKHRKVRASKTRHPQKVKRLFRDAIADAQINQWPKGPRNKWLPTDVDPIFVGVVLVELIIFAYFLSTTELIIIKTGVNQKANHDWGFGQVFAVMVVTPSVVALYRGMKENKVRPRRRDRRELRGRKHGSDRAAEEGRADLQNGMEPATPSTETGLRLPDRGGRSPSGSYNS